MLICIDGSIYADGVTCYTGTFFIHFSFACVSFVISTFWLICMAMFYIEINIYSKNSLAGPIYNKVLPVILRKMAPVIIFFLDPNRNYCYIAYILLLVFQIIEKVLDYMLRNYYKKTTYLAYRVIGGIYSYTLLCTGIALMFDKGDIEENGIFCYYLLSLPIYVGFEYYLIEYRLGRQLVSNYNNVRSLNKILGYFILIWSFLLDEQNKEVLIKKDAFIKMHKRYCLNYGNECTCNQLTNDRDLLNEKIWDEFLFGELEDKGKRFVNTFEIIAFRCYILIEKRKNVYRAQAQVLSSTKRKLSAANHFQLHRLKINIENILYNQDSEQDKKLNKFVEFENTSYQFMQYIKRSTVIKVKLLELVACDDPQLRRMDRLCNEMIDYQKRIHSYHKYLNSISDNCNRITEIYGAYLLLVTNDRNSSSEVYDKLCYSFGLNNTKNSKTDDKDIAIIVISGNEEDRGIVVNVNQEMIQILKCKKCDIIGNSLNTIMPNCFGQWHNDYMEKFAETGNSTVIGSKRKIFVMKKDGFIEKATLYVKIQSNQNLGIRIVGFIFIDYKKRKFSDEMMTNNDRTAILCYELYSGKIECVNDICSYDYGIKPINNYDDKYDAANNEHNMKNICPELMLSDSEIKKLKYGMLVEFDTTCQDVNKNQKEDNEFELVYEIMAQESEDYASMDVENSDFENHQNSENVRRQEEHAILENKINKPQAKNNVPMKNMQKLGTQDSSSNHEKIEKKNLKQSTFYSKENGTKETGSKKLDTDKADTGTRTCGDQPVVYRKVNLLARLEYIQQHDKNEKYIFIKLQGQTKFNTNLQQNIENLEITETKNIKTVSRSNNSVRKNVNITEKQKLQGKAQVVQITDKLEEEDDDFDEEEDADSEDNSQLDDGESLIKSVKSYKTDKSNMATGAKLKKKRRRKKRKTKEENSEVRNKRAERIRKKHRNFFFVKCSETTSSNMITEDNKEIVETKKSIAEKENSPVIWKVALFGTVFFITLILLFMVRLLFRLSFIDYFKTSIDCLHYSYSTAIFIPRVTYYSRFMELIASGITFTGTDGSTRYLTAKDNIVQDLNLLNLNYVNLLAYLNQQGLKREVLPYNITDNRTLSNGNTFLVNDSIYNHYSTYIGQGVTLENADISKLAENSTSGGFYNNVRQSYQYQQVNGFGTLFSYSELLSDNYYEIVEKNMSGQVTNILAVFLSEVIVISLSGLLQLPLFIGSEKFNRAIYVLYIMLSVKEAEFIAHGTKQFLKVYFINFEGDDGNNNDEISRYDIDLSEYSETLGTENASGSNNQGSSNKESSKTTKNKETIKGNERELKAINEVMNNEFDEKNHRKADTLRPDLDSSMVDEKMNYHLEYLKSQKSKVVNDKPNNSVSQNLSDSRFHGSMPSNDHSQPNINYRNFDDTVNYDNQKPYGYTESDARIMTTEGNVENYDEGRLYTEGEVLMTETKGNYDKKEGLIDEKLEDSLFLPNCIEKMLSINKSGQERRDSSMGQINEENIEEDQEDQEDQKDLKDQKDQIKNEQQLEEGSQPEFYDQNQKKFNNLKSEKSIKDKEEEIKKDTENGKKRNQVGNSLDNKSDAQKNENDEETQNRLNIIIDDKIQRFIVVSNKSVKAIVYKALCGILLFLSLNVVEFFLVYNLALQVNSITSTFRNLKNMQNRINNIYGMAYESVAREVNTLQIDGIDVYSLSKTNFWNELRMVEDFNGSNPPVQLSTYLDMFNDLMYTDVCTNYIKAYNQGTCNLELYNSGLLTIITNVMDNTDNWITDIGTASDKDSMRKSLLTSQLSDDMYQAAFLSVNALNSTTIKFKTGANDFGVYMMTVTKIFLICQVQYLIILLGFLLQYYLRKLNSDFNKVKLLTVMLPTDIIENNNRIGLEFKKGGVMRF